MVDDEGNRGDVRASSRRSGASRPGRTGRELLALIRAGGELEIPVRDPLSHQAGLPAIRKQLPLGAAYDWEVMAKALAEEEPWWEPGTKHGYHAFTYGWLIGEVMRRITGESVGTYWRKEIAEPLGVDFQIGLPPEDDA